MKKILEMYSGNQRELVSFWVELIIFLEKEIENWTLTSKYYLKSKKWVQKIDVGLLRC